MFTLIKKLAEIEGLDSEVDIKDSLDYPNGLKNVIFIELETKNNKLNYKKIDSSEDIQEQKIDKYLYKIVKGNVSGQRRLSPTIKYSTFKEFEERTLLWFKSHQNEDFFKQIFNVLDENKETIKENLINYKNVLLSLKIDGKYIGDFDEFRQFFISDEKIKENYSTKYGKTKVFLENSTCCICHSLNKEVYGFASPFAFYTVDSRGFTYNFDQKSSVKQLPICLDCAKKINGKGKKYLEKNLNFKLFNMNYYLIPELINDNPTRFKEIVEKINQKYKAIETKKTENNPLPDKKDGAAIRRLEDEFLEELSKENNSLNYNFFFYELKQAKIDILASIEEVAPTNLRKFFEIVKEISYEFQENDINSFSNVYDNPLFVIKNFMVDKDNKKLDKAREEFCAVLDKIFNLKPLSYSYMLNKFMRRINEQIPKYLQSNEKDYFKKNVLDSFYLINVFKRLGLFKNNIKLKYGDKKDDMEKLKTPLLDEFCKLFPNYFNLKDEKYEIKKAILAYGILVEQIAYIQTQYYNNKDSKPIYKKFKNFKVDSRFLCNKFSELKSYIQKYRKTENYLCYRAEKILEELSKCIANHQNNELSVGETSYLFVLGISLSWEFIEKSFPKKETL